MKTATLIKDNLRNFTGHAALYKLSEPLEGYSSEEDNPSYEFVICSTAYTFGLETYIFGSNENGDVLNWCELKGSMKGTSYHSEVLSNAGYELLKQQS